MIKTILISGFLFFTQLAAAQEMPLLNDGYYNIDDGSNCTYRIASYPGVKMVIVNIADSVEGYFCPYRSTIYKFKCKNNLCNYEGRKLYVLSQDRLVLEFPNGVENNLTFAATKIPAANKLTEESSMGWMLSQPDSLVQTKRGLVHFRELIRQDIIDAGSCEIAEQDAVMKAVKACQNKGFSRCMTKKTNYQFSINQFWPGTINLFTGCTSEVMVQGAK